MTAVPIERTGRYVCPVCPHRFESLVDKKHHVKTEHPRLVKR